MIKNSKWKAGLLILCIICLVVAGIGILFINNTGNDSPNEIVPVNINVTLTSDYKDNKLIKNSTINNNGREEEGTAFDVYVRAMVVPIWKDESRAFLGREIYNGSSGMLTYKSSNGSVIEISVRKPKNWLYKDGVFYYTGTIAPGESVDFVNKVRVLYDGKVSERIYDLEVQILAQGVGADSYFDGVPAAEYLWKDVTVDSDGEGLILKQ
ncbi:MAG: hypothetical protein E7218_02310 [Anaerofustis stercorihominis]|nr:hypothetical protein [Anaerofustis stercorihominis]